MWISHRPRATDGGILIPSKACRSENLCIARKNRETVIIYVSGEKPVISCTLGFWGYSWNTLLYINEVFMVCGPHLQGCVQHCSWGELLWVLTALESLAQPATLLRAAEKEGYNLLSDGMWRRFLRYIWRMHENMRVQWSQYSVQHFDWEKSWKRSLLQIYEAISANAAQKSWLSAPPGKGWSVTHIFITIVPYHTGQLIGKSCMFFFQA